MRAIGGLAAVLLGCAVAPNVRVAKPEPCVCAPKSSDCDKPSVAVARERKQPLPDAFRQDVAEEALSATDFAAAAATAASITCPRIAAFTKSTLDVAERGLVQPLVAAHEFLIAPSDDPTQHKILAWAMYNDALDELRSSVASSLTAVVAREIVMDENVELAMAKARYDASTHDRAAALSSHYRSFMEAVAIELLKPLTTAVTLECTDQAMTLRRPGWLMIFKGKH